VCKIFKKSSGAKGLNLLLPKQTLTVDFIVYGFVSVQE
jgi:hypothetical protein